MLGASIYLSTGLEENLKLLDYFNKHGVKNIFTSLHLKEENPKKTEEELTLISNCIQKNNQKLMVDVSSETLKIYDLKFGEFINFLKKFNITSLRIDYGFSIEEIKELEKQFNLIFNASTIDDDFVEEMKKFGIDISKVTACHNFYPRLDTGLSRESFDERNRYLKDKGFKIQAFIPGDKKRGPFMEGLPTIEDHRFKNPFVSYVELSEEYNIDDILIGDISVREQTLKNIKEFENERIINLEVDKIISIPDQLSDIFWKEHKNRRDYSSRVVRSTLTRIEIKEDIEENNTIQRKAGTITIDNKNYLRYNGELQITMIDLDSDNRVNVIGNIKYDYVDLLKYIKNDIGFRFIKE